jgi:glycosyltransferase involved in cell wall biosynthesis
MRLAIITTHPIQYYAPIFKLLQQRDHISLKVFYTLGEAGKLNKYDTGFKKVINWDVPLLDGYEHEFVENTAPQPGSHHFKGIINPDIISRINAFNPNAILMIGWAYSGHLKVLRYYKGKVPVYFRGDSNLLDEKPTLKQVLRQIWLKWIYSHVDHAFYVGTNNKAYYLKYGLKNSALSFAPHAINNEVFGIDRTTESKALRTSLDIADDAILILFAGKFEDKKDPLLLLQAFINLNQTNVYLLFTGNGVLEFELKKLTGQNPNIKFLGFQNQSAMPAVYQACDLFCLPSKGPAETWGLAVNEAMACGKAVLVSGKVGCAIDLVKPGYNGDIFKTGSVIDLGEKLSGLLAYGKAGLAEMGANSKNIIRDWSFENIAIAIENKLLHEKI